MTVTTQTAIAPAARRIPAGRLAVYGVVLAIGLVLERGVLEGSKAFERELERAGIDHRVDYSPSGLHNWVNFMKNFDAGWDYIKGDLGLV